MAKKRRRGYIGLDEQRAARARLALDRIRNKLIERNSVADIRAAMIYEALVEWGDPLTIEQISQLTDIPLPLINHGDTAPLKHLLWEGRVGYVHGLDNRRTRKYYADPDLSKPLTEYAPLKDID